MPVLVVPRSTVNARNFLYILLHFGWHALGLALMVALASLVAWDTWQFWKLAEGRSLVPITVGAYLAVLWVQHQLLRLPQVGSLASAFLSVGLTFLLLLAVLAMGRLYYSRSFLLVAFMLTLLWQVVGWRLARKFRPRVALVPGGMVHELTRLPGFNWVLLENPSPLPVDAVVADLHLPHPAAWVRFLAECSLRRIPVYHAAVVYEGITGRVSLGHHSQESLEAIQLPPLYPPFKRLFDLLVVLVLAPVHLPLLLLLALLVWLDSPGRVLFWQQRVGQGGHPFWIVKFRTMRPDAEENGPQFAGIRDGRITRLGAFMRRFRLDELPQLWNVLRGEMSLIGPRPEQLPFAEQFAQEIPIYPYRHLARPGLTGWAQVMQGYAANHDETLRKLAHDLYYVKHLSPWLDALIVFKTIRILLTGFGAR